MSFAKITVFGVFGSDWTILASGRRKIDAGKNQVGPRKTLTAGIEKSNVANHGRFRERSPS